MRKIEKAMIEAIRTGRSRVLGNTAVLVNTTHHGTEWTVTLHGNLIAKSESNGRIAVTLAGWPTPTTRSRINALLRAFAPGYARVYQWRGGQYFDHAGYRPREIDANEWVTV